MSSSAGGDFDGRSPQATVGSRPSGEDSSSGGQPNDIDSLSLRELSALKEVVDADVARLQEELRQMQKGIEGFKSALQAVEELSRCSPNQPALVPLSESVYVQGKSRAVDWVMVDVGGGYNVQKSSAEVDSFCKERIQILADRSNTVSSTLTEKETLAVVVQRKLNVAIQTLQRSGTAPVESTTA